MTLVIVVLLSVLAGVFSYHPLWTKISDSRPWSLGLDLAGGTRLIYEVDLSEIESYDRNSVVEGLRDVIERRVNLFGVSEPRVYEAKIGESRRLIIELAGVTDVKSAIDEIGTTPFLDFREVEEVQSETKPEEVKDKVILRAEDQTTTKIGETAMPTLTETPTAPTLKFIETNLTGRYIKGAQVLFDQVTGQASVSINFDKEGGDRFEELTRKNIGKPLAIFLDNTLISMPIVQDEIAGGRAQITGDFTPDEARELVRRFNAGALPAPITLINQHTISAGLGKDSLERTVFAGAIGTLLIIIFMIGYYKKLGVFAALALIMYIALTLAIFKVIPITMTLAGIAGFILSIGIAVDANILVFERTKEELKRGLAAQDAVEEGFRRAWTSIRDSNITTILTAIILYYFTSSFVRGFALTLFIGVVVSMFSAITITRTLLRVFMKNKKV